MDSMDTQKAPGIMAKLRNSKGFSLIEMAIVLVIIGIIIAAIIKGQDLMVNSRAKQLVATANAWKISAMAYMDRNGKLPGVVPGTSLIDSTAAVGTAIDSIADTMAQAPQNPVMIGGQSWYFFFGACATSPDTGPRNVIVICKDATCNTTISKEEAEMLKALDNSIDGSSGALIGQVRGFVTATFTPGTAVATGARTNGSVKLTTTDLTDTSPAGDTGTAQWGPTYKGAAWAFDKPF